VGSGVQSQQGTKPFIEFCFKLFGTPAAATNIFLPVRWGISVPHRQWQRVYGHEADDTAEVGKIKEYQLMKKLISCMAAVVLLLFASNVLILLTIRSGVSCSG